MTTPEILANLKLTKSRGYNLPVTRGEIEAIAAAVADYEARCGQDRRMEALKAQAEDLQAKLEWRL